MQAETVPHLEIGGSPGAMGEAHGRALRDLIHGHLAASLAQLDAAGLPPADARAWAGRYGPFVRAHAPGLAEELEGLARGADLEMKDALVLQLRAELRAQAETMAGVGECSAFAASGSQTRGGIPLAGQNADLPAYAQPFVVVLEAHPDGAPAFVMLTLAGQLGYLGINDAGLGVLAAFLHSRGWRVGFPRYLLSRVVLGEATLGAAVERLASIPRAASRNLILVEESGALLDLELGVDRCVALGAVQDRIAHTNHFLAPAMGDLEASPPERLEGSEARLDRLESLLEARQGELDLAGAMEVLRDHGHGFDRLCRHDGEDASEVGTVASLIMEPLERALWVAPGPPCSHPYSRFTS